KGMHKEIQGITILEAPDGFKWTKGKEMILSSGYSLKQDPDCVKKAFEDGTLQKTSALILKVGRYIDRVPDEITMLCNKFELPLIIAPFSAPWMEIISQTNVAVMNRTIRNFQVSDPSAGSRITNQSYKETKIRKILHAVENEMKFPAMLYDISEDKSYHSSPNFKRMTESYNLKDSDYW
ncbi:MAG: PucR family transcriptional regulator ligand-binding domain-containing protein, partial [Bacillota bacterium]|nr:PucR family transcriptional regulator ligand-binding domain-containing protein [Bacillota bacterium]